MRAAVLATPGEPPAFGEHPDPEPGPEQTLVRVTAAPIVPLDLLCASGTSYFGRPAVPYVPGAQGVGVVQRSAAHPVGTRVWFATSAGMAPGDGGLAELCAVPDVDAVPLTVDVRDVDLAALGLSAVAAWMALTWRARLARGENVVVLGGGGAVGQVAIGAARLLGAARVVAVARAGPSAERAGRAGAHEVVLLTSDVADLAAALEKALDGTAHVVIDPVFGVAASAASRVLGPGGRLVNLGGAAGDLAELSSSVLRSRSVDVLGYTNNALSPQQRAEALTAVATQAASGALAVDSTVLPLARVADGWRQTAEGAVGGRVVVVP